MIRLVVITIALFLAIIALASSLAANTAVNRHYDAAETYRPSVHDMVMQSRQTEGIQGDNRLPLALYGAGIFAIAIIGGFGFVVGTERIKGLLREWRLATKKRRRPRRQVMGQVEHLPRLEDETSHF